MFECGNYPNNKIPWNWFISKFSGEQPSTSCSINEIQCETGECVPALARCNNVQECQDGSDERGCGNTREYFEDIQHLATW